MPFVNKREINPIVSDIEFDLRKKQKNKELSNAGNELDRINQEIDRKIEIEKQYQDFTKEAVIKSLELKKIDTEIEKKKETIKNLDIEISNKEITKNKLNEKEKIVEKLEQNIALLNKQLSPLNDKITELKNEIDILQKEIAGLFIEKEKEVNQFIIDKELIIADIEKLQRERELLFDETNSLDKKYNKLTADFIKLKKEKEEFIATATLGLEENQKKFQEKIEQRNSEFIKREGLNSEKETWLKDKAEELRNIKMELEKYHNKKININI